MKILALNWRDITHPNVGGAEVNVHEVLKKLVKRKHKVTLFCSSYKGCKEYENIDGIEIIRYGNDKTTIYLWAFIFYLFKFRRENYDLIFENISGTPWMSMLYSRKPKIAIIYHIIGDIYFKEIFFPMALVAIFVESYVMPLFYKNEKVLAISKSSKEELCNLGFRNLEVISLGINKNLKPNLKVKSKNPIIIHHGRLMNYKRVDILIRLMKEVVKQHKNIQLYIFGRGESEEKLKKLTKEFNLENNIEFFGFVSEKKKSELLQKSWIFVTPSYKEGWGLVVLEANACGVPAIAFNVQGLKNSIVNNKTGYLVKDEEEMLEKILKLINNDKIRIQMSKEAIEWSKNFSWDKTEKQISKIIKEVIQTHK